MPASLQGEYFDAAEYSYATTGSIDISGECTPTVGETFTLTYEAEGVASGPYPGTFRESGTVTATVTGESGPGAAFGVVATWSAEFSIDSPVGDVTGRKTFAQELPSASACHRKRDDPH